jgi:hypothetical protein
MHIDGIFMILVFFLIKIDIKFVAIGFVKVQFYLV